MRPLVSFFALLLPAVVLGLGLSWLGRSQPRPPHPSRAMHDRLMQGDPDIVMLGASKLSTDIDKPALARALGIAPAGLVTLGMSGTSSPVWYTVLENRVVRAGHTPKLILVYSTLDWMLSTDLSRPGRAVIDAQRGDAEPVLQAKVFKTGVQSPFWERVEASRGASREAWLAAIRDYAVGSALGTGGEDVIAEGNALAGPALQNLFGLGAAVIEGGGHRAIPVVEGLRDNYAIKATTLDDTLVPDLVALAKAAGAHIVFVRAPVRADSERLHGAPPELEGALVQYLNEQGEGYVDLRDLHLPASAFGDTSHVGAGGRTTVTRELAARLLALNAMDAAPLPETQVKADHGAPTATRHGSFTPLAPPKPPRRGNGPCDSSVFLPPALTTMTDDTLTFAGLGAVSPLVLLEDGQPLKMHAPQPAMREPCAGVAVAQNRMIRYTPTDEGAHTYTVSVTDELPLLTDTAMPAWWVYPEGSVRLTWKEAWAPGPRQLHVAGWIASPASAPERAPTVKMGGTITEMRGGSGYWSLDADVPDGAMDVEVFAPDGFFYLQTLRLGNAEDQRYAIGSAAPTTVSSARGALTFAQAPPVYPLPAPTAAGLLASWDLASTGVPDADELRRRATVSNCSPFVVVEDGKPLAEQVGSRLAVEQRGAGRYGQEGQTMFAIGSDGRSPAENGRTYQLLLSEDRKCRGMRWLYPGDLLTVLWQPGGLPSLPGDPTHLELAGGSDATAESTATLRVAVFSSEREVLRTELLLRDFPTKVPLLPFAAPLPRSEPVRLELSLATDSPWLLITAIGLRQVP